VAPTNEYRAQAGLGLPAAYHRCRRQSHPRQGRHGRERRNRRQAQGRRGEHRPDREERGDGTSRLRTEWDRAGTQNPVAWHRHRQPERGSTQHWRHRWTRSRSTHRDLREGARRQDGGRDRRVIRGTETQRSRTPHRRTANPRAERWDSGLGRQDGRQGQSIPSGSRTHRRQHRGRCRSTHPQRSRRGKSRRREARYG
jgi:hypothetical protein